MATTMVHIRVDEKVKEQAAKNLSAMGLSVSDAVRILLVRVAAEKALPFDVKVPNRTTAKAMQAADRGKGKRFKSATILVMSHDMPYQALLGDPNIRFDPRKFNWIGSPEQTNRACAAIEGAPVQKASDLFEHELLVGGAGAGTIRQQYAGAAVETARHEVQAHRRLWQRRECRARHGKRRIARALPDGGGAARVAAGLDRSGQVQDPVHYGARSGAGPRCADDLRIHQDRRAAPHHQPL